jgi:hypothetical protein
VTACAFYRGYVNDSKRAGQVKRLHILRDTGTHSMEPRKLGWCGTTGWDVTDSRTVLISPLPARPPEGLRWCPSCIGRYAERIGLLDDIAGEVAAYDPGLA